MKLIISVLIFITIAMAGFSQQSSSRLDLRTGIGTSFLGTGDMLTIMFENELNFQFSKYFTTAGGFGFAKGNMGVIERVSFIQANGNLYFSPFQNIHSFDLRIGTGVSWYWISDVYKSSATYHDGQLIELEYTFDKRNSIGFNAILEGSYSISKKFLLGLKIFIQPYLNGDINSGVMLKFGFKI
jgi:hypothetical protein